jgi:hypothetical protein
MRFRSFVVAVLGLGLVITVAPASTALADVSAATCEQLASQTANSPSEHAVLAKYFRQKAADLRKKAAGHRRRGALFLSSKSPSAPALRLHADATSRRQRKLADEYDRMAAEQELHMTAGS